MRRPSVFALLLVLSMAASNEASGQLCAGMASFSAGPLRLAGMSQFDDNSSMLGGALALGATDGAFGGAYAGRASLKDVEESGTSYGGHIGFAAPVDQAKKVELCPTATVDRLTGNFDSGFGAFDVSSTRFGLALGIGASAGSSPNFDVVPFGSVAYNRATSSSTFGGVTDKASYDLGILIVGAGFVLNKIVTVQPNVAIPFGIEGENPIYGITVAINVGKKNK